MNLRAPPPSPGSPFSGAVAALRAAGHQVEPAEGMLGLCVVDRGPELTMSQVVDLAAQKRLI